MYFENNPKRILHVVSSMNRGGAETMIMNLYRQIDRTKIQFDFVSHVTDKSAYDDEILSLGGRIYKIPSLGHSGPVSYTKNLCNILKKNGPFTAVHAHTDFQTGFAALAARLSGVKVRICHSHNTAWKPNLRMRDNVLFWFCKQLISSNATSYCACGDEAARFLFSDYVYNSGQVRYLQNGIDLELFKQYYDADRQHIRAQFGISDDTILIGHVGRFYEQKNHVFIVNLAEKMKKRGLNFKIFLVGDGPLRSDIEKRVVNKGLDNHFKFLGVRDDVPMLMRIFDVFILPSLFEGLPVVLVESQAIGTPCLVSDVVTDEADLGLGLIVKRKLNEPLEKWITEILNINKLKRPIWEKIHMNLSKRGYNVQDNIVILDDLYHINK
ncbi:glycosyltransferase EpsF [Neobacillus niacini]|uniref:glycosyltransferase family 1 protein n=1 Tax=Neobacillus niacini TaxID=86668 RepID=UPI002783C7E6|nr:glycosyltransferase family 1 protein [Neobacillus niacini]MDQ1000334.1 glycosyltransferase EpsF [Neobacillus niacini]